jgi:hypothetical protein
MAPEDMETGYVEYLVGFYGEKTRGYCEAIAEIIFRTEWEDGEDS